MNRLLRSLRELVCGHVFRICDLEREGDGDVSARCTKCGKLCFAFCGLSLRGRLTGPITERRHAD